MAIEFVGSAAAQSAGNGANVVVPLNALTGGIDTAARAGDLVLAFGAVPSNTAAIDFSGYTNIDEGVNSASTGRSCLMYKFMGSTPDSSVTFTGDLIATSSTAALVMVFRGVDPTTPMDATATTATGSSTNPDCPSITVATNEGVVAAFAFSIVNDSTVTVPTGYAGLRVINGSNDTNTETLAAAYLGGRNQATAEDPAAFTGWSTGSWRAISVALRPAPTNIVYVGSAIAATLDGSDCVINLASLTGGAAAAAAAGDFVMVCGGHTGAADAGVSTSGYTEIIDQSNTIQQSVSWKVMGGTPDTSVTGIGSGDATRGSAYYAMVFRNVEPLAPIDVASTVAVGSSTTPDSPLIVQASANCCIVSAVVSAAASASPVRPQHLCRTVFANSDDTVGDATAAGSFRTQRVAGAFNPPSWTGFVSGAWASVSMVLRPKTIAGFDEYYSRFIGRIGGEVETA